MAAGAPTASWQRGKVTSWVTSTDHKRIGQLYVGTSLLFLAAGGILALLLRAQLTVHDATVLGSGTFAKLDTVHGTTMLFLVALPLVLGLASFLVPLMIGARSVAAPRALALSYWLYLLGGILLWASWFSRHGPAKADFGDAASIASAAGKGEDLWLLALLLIAISFVVCCGTLLLTIGGERAEGMTARRLPLYVWSAGTSAAILLVGSLVLAGAVALMLLDRNGGTHVFDSAHGGGGAIAWRHAFWFFGQPAIVTLLLSTLGILAEVIPVFARRKIACYEAVRLSILAIGALGLLTWGQHLYTTDMPTWADVAFTITSLALIAPVVVILVQLTATVLGGTLTGRLAATSVTAIVAALTSLAFLALGATTWVFLAAQPLASQTGASQFASGWFNTLVFGGGGLAVYAGLFYWWPKITGRRLDEWQGFGVVGALATGSIAAFFPQFLLGLLGMPLHAPSYGPGGVWQTLNVVSTIGAGLLGLGVAGLLANIARTAVLGRRCGRDPWLGDTLEWYTESPPPPHNFDSVPVVSSVRPVHDLRERLHGPNA